ncbi:MAG: alpha amylase C-terminal domain-containing protein [Alphaproteobacteria bacterium]|nr:alpha amylase C-terminal domain-containing protein [Alphaproteobacteria bacterium]
MANLLERDRFGERWAYHPLRKGDDGLWEIDVGGLGLPDGSYEYEFILDDDHGTPVADPFAREITRFAGYRGIFHIRGGVVWVPPFDWTGELPDGQTLPENNRLVVYEMPLRWMDGDAARQVGLGTFERVIFEHLDTIAKAGVNCIELLPVHDSADTLNWGYGSRFFFAPDIDMGVPVDLKLLVKRCHQRGIRVILDVVMNHARECPLQRLAKHRYFIEKGEEGRDSDYGGKMFRYREPVDGRHWARQFHFDIARFWIDEYHVDGFRIDEFKGIDNWQFIQQFRDHAWSAFRERFPDRPFIVIAEDSWCRTAVVHDDRHNPDGRRVADAIWNFGARDEFRRLLLNEMHTQPGQPSRTERIVALVAGSRRWDDWSKRFDGGFADMAQSITYLTSHDVEQDGERRLMNHVLSSLLRYFGHGDGGVAQVRGIATDLASDAPRTPPAIRDLYHQALERVRSGHALLLTSFGIPMLLAGEEFGDLHDTDHHEWQFKMSDPVDWHRRRHPGHGALADAVADLVQLRTGHPALHRNEVAFLHVHPTLDQNDGRRVFAYCRTGGRPLGDGGQVVVVANCGPDAYSNYTIPWPWTGASAERGRSPVTSTFFQKGGASVTLTLAPFEVRVFETY